MIFVYLALFLSDGLLIELEKAVQKLRLGKNEFIHENFYFIHEYIFYQCIIFYYVWSPLGNNSTYNQGHYIHMNIIQCTLYMSYAVAFFRRWVRERVWAICV